MRDIGTILVDESHRIGIPGGVVRLLRVVRKNPAIGETPTKPLRPHRAPGGKGRFLEAVTHRTFLSIRKPRRIVSKNLGIFHATGRHSLYLEEIGSSRRWHRRRRRGLT